MEFERKLFNQIIMKLDRRKDKDSSKFSLFCLFVVIFIILTFAFVKSFTVLHDKKSLISPAVSLKEQQIGRKKDISSSQYVQSTTTKPKLIKYWDSRTVFRTNETDSTQQLSLVDDFEAVLKNHPLFQLSAEQLQRMQMEDYFVYLQEQPACQNIPIFTGMGNVFSQLYWQMIENFVYTMVKFQLSGCAVMICVSDPLCMQKCSQAHFPCIDFNYTKFHPENPDQHPSPLEQIASLKLYHIPKALAKQVNVIMVDLDVGFLSSPMHLVKMIQPTVDIYVQKDIAYVMNRSLEGWRTWYTIPLPNIGLFYVRGNEKTVRMFHLAWDEYQELTDTRKKNNPGKDQNKVAYAMHIAQGSYGLVWRYFPASSAVLLDMVYKFNDPSYELGGEAATTLLTPLSSLKQQKKKTRHQMSSRTKDVGAIEDDVIAVHTTCYEQKSKIMGLKAANAFWNPYYYQANKRTITKPIIFFTEDQLRNEIRSLIYLGYVTNRSVIIPNILGRDILDVYDGKNLWPGFRSFFQKSSFPYSIEILEPAFYWRIQRDYPGQHMPAVTVLSFVEKYLSSSSSPSSSKHHGEEEEAMKIKSLSLLDIEHVLQSKEYQAVPRIVLSITAFELSDEKRNWYNDHVGNDWAQDSVGAYLSYQEELQYYGQLPAYGSRGNSDGYSDQVEQTNVARTIAQHSRSCNVLFHFDYGNRSCFNKCK